MAEKEPSVRETIKKLMKDMNYDPFKEMILIAKDPDTDPRTRASMASELAQYVAPKLKGVELDAHGTLGLQLIVQRFADLGDDDSKSKLLENGH